MFPAIGTGKSQRWLNFLVIITKTVNLAFWVILIKSQATLSLRQIKIQINMFNMRCNSGFKSHLFPCLSYNFWSLLKQQGSGFHRKIDFINWILYKFSILANFIYVFPFSPASFPPANLCFIKSST